MEKYQAVTIKDNLTTFIALPILTTQWKSLKYNVPYKRFYTLCMVTDHLTWYKPELIQVLSCWLPKFKILKRPLNIWALKFSIVE